jgi:hypothetical protein
MAPLMGKKCNDFGELLCTCGDEVWDHEFAEGYCVIRKCGCEKFKQAYE